MARYHQRSVLAQGPRTVTEPDLVGLPSKAAAAIRAAGYQVIDWVRLSCGCVRHYKCLKPYPSRRGSAPCPSSPCPADKTFTGKRVADDRDRFRAACLRTLRAALADPLRTEAVVDFLEGWGDMQGLPPLGPRGEAVHGAMTRAFEASGVGFPPEVGFSDTPTPGGTAFVAGFRRRPFPPLSCVPSHLEKGETPR